MSDGYRDELLIDGILYRRSHDPGEVLYHSLNGSLPVTRATYRRVGERNGPTVAPVDVNYKMAYVGTVGFVDEDGDFLATRKYAATHHEGPEGIVARMVADVRAAKLRESTLHVGLVQDGAPEMWNLTRGGLEKEPSVDAYLEAIDRYHLSERFGDVLKVLEADLNRRAELMKKWVQFFSVDAPDDPEVRPASWPLDRRHVSVGIV